MQVVLGHKREKPWWKLCTWFCLFLSSNAEKQEDERVLESYIGSFQMRYIQIKYASKMNTVSIRVHSYT